MDWVPNILAVLVCLIEGFGRGFKGFEQQDYATNFSGKLTYNPNQHNTGSQLTFSPSWGKSTGSTQVSLWQSNLADENDFFNHYSNGLQIDTLNLVMVLAC